MKTLILDFDGTLLDSRKRHRILLEDLCQQSDLCIPCDGFSNYLEFKINGGSTFQYLTEVVKYPQEVSEKIAKQWIQKIELPTYLAFDELYQDTLGFLKREKKNGWNMVLLSARQRRDYLITQVQQLQLEPFFSSVICVSPQNAAKEKSNVLSTLSDVRYYIGDTEVDYRAACGMNVPFYALNRGFRSKKYWMEQGVISHEVLPKENI